jgi:hypothetical protein
LVGGGGYMRELLSVALCGLVLGACSVVLDTEKKQCSSDSQCADPYTCETKSGLCVRPKCTGDGDCRNGICEKTLCEQKQCTMSGDCEDGQACDPTGRCVDAECKNNDECGPLATAKCQGGMCVDELWGCRDENDERPEPTMPKATYVLKVYEFPGGAPVDDLMVKVCASVDAMCANPLADPTVAIDAEGVVTIGNLPQNTFIHLLLSGPTVYTTHFYSQRPVRDVGGEVIDLGLVQQGLLDLASVPSGKPVDTENNGTLLARVFNCKGEGGEGVSFAVSEVGPATEVFYSENDYQPNPDLQATSASGVFAVANMKPGSSIRVTGTVDGQDVTAQTVTAYPQVVTVVNFYPRNYR